MGKTRKSVRIVIVGAGASGIAAATRLLEKGFRNVLLLEAESRVGGRIQTLPFADNVVDLGAQWCHGEQDNAVYSLVKNTNLTDGTGNYFKDVKNIRSDKEIVNDEEASALKRFLTNSLPKETEEYKGSVGQCLAENYCRGADQLKDPKLAQEILECFKRSQSSLVGSDNLDEVSGRTHLEYKPCDGDQLIHWHDKGFYRFLQLLMKADPENINDLGVIGERLLLNKKINKINWEPSVDEIRVHTTNEETFLADYVICTMSLGVLKYCHKDLFHPPLPCSKLQAIQGLKLGTVDKIYLEFLSLPDSFIGFYSLWLEEDLQELRQSKRFWLEGISGCHRVLNQPRILQIWIGGEHGRYMETLQEAEILEALQWLFQKFLSFDIPHPQRIVRTQWHSNTNFRGSYSFRTTFADQLATGPWDLEEPLSGLDGNLKVLFAGEATSRNHYSTVHGAIEAGWREANRLNDLYLD
ncbi:uncharacterized protein Dwil_GK19151 [Drosophila willistoni]|uniref:Amine oxidase domain-containing protein n=1 Tax=Drosophila willistoni TaxID=7260 RepID=B4N3R1_DROWI|nr:spermine oxidase [Drosophila willistoni]EDW79266.1 uncharacterized protein Dwil_GK19151 [Drosophila willistoni]